MSHSPSRRWRRRSVSSHHGRISRHGLYDLSSFLSGSPEGLECDRLHASFVRGYLFFFLLAARAAAVTGLCCASDWYLSASGSLTVMSISSLRIQALGHFTLRSRSASWHFHSSSSYHHLLSSGTAHPPSTSAPSLRSWSGRALYTEFSSLILEGELLQSRACFGPLRIALSRVSFSLPVCLHPQVSVVPQTQSQLCRNSPPHAAQPVFACLGTHRPRGSQSQVLQIPSVEFVSVVQPSPTCVLPRSSPVLR